MIKTLIKSRLKVAENIPAGIRWKYRARLRKALLLSYQLANILDVKPNTEVITDFSLLIPLVDIEQDITGEKIAPENIDKCLYTGINEDWCKLLREINSKLNSQKFIEAIKKVAYYQYLSVEPITKSHLEEITFGKGGYTGLALLYLLKPNLVYSPKEEKAFYDLGKLLQLSDDYQDRKKDALEGYVTLFTEGFYSLKDVDNLRKKVMSEFYELYDKNKVRLLDYSFRLYIFASSGRIFSYFSDVVF